MSSREEVIIRGSRKCQDCGNQAKKSCEYMRCRTCCKNKGFQCETHVKSTWIPVDHRRRIHQQFPPITHKHNSTNPDRDHEEPSKFPATANLTAKFRWVQVRSMDDLVNEYAYHACVSIGGHLFSGLLYDQGPSSSLYSSISDDHHHGEYHHPSGSPLVLQHHSLMMMNNASTSQSHNISNVDHGATLMAHHHHQLIPSSSSAPHHHDSSNVFSPAYPFPFPHHHTTTFMPGMPYYSSHPKP